jgi:hypothetical protein
VRGGYGLIVILLAASCDQAGSEYLRKRSWSTASLSFPGAAAIASLAWTGIGKPSAVSRRNSPRVRGDAPLSPHPFLQLALCSLWSLDLHMQILSQGNFFVHVA